MMITMESRDNVITWRCERTRGATHVGLSASFGQGDARDPRIWASEVKHGWSCIVGQRQTY